MDEAIRAEGLRKQYGDLVAVAGLSFAVQRGQVFGLLGPNGAGKTTTIRMLVGLSEPSAGRAWVNGFDVVGQRVQAKASLGVVPELSNLYPELTCLDNLLYISELYGVPRRERAGRCRQLLEEFGLAEKANVRFETLSRGLKRRLTIAAALVHRPALLFLDEPTTGLDVVSARNLRALVRRLNAEGATILLTTHLISEAEELCDTLGLLVKGKLVALDSPQGLKARVQELPALEVLTEQAPSSALLDRLRDTPAITEVSPDDTCLHLRVTSIHEALDGLVRWSRETGAVIHGINTRGVSLEDAFVRLTGIEAEIMRVDKPQKTGGGG